MRPVAGGAGRRLADEVQQRALEQAVQPLPARIDDAGLAQDGQQARRPGDRLLGRVERGGQDRLDVVVALGGDDRGVGRFADDRQDRPLDRLGDRAVGRLRPLRQRVREVEAVEPALAAEPLGHAAEDLAGDDPGVAAGAHQRPEADRGGDPLGRLTGHAFGLVERGLDGRQHVRAGVAVRDGIDVEGVDLVDVRLEVRDRRAEGAEQALAVARAADHQATSVPLSARSRGPTASVAAWMTVGGAPPGPNRRPSMWIVTRPTSRPSACRSAVADRRIDLAGDLRDRDAEGDGQVELDVDRVAEMDGDARLGESETPEQALVRSRREPDDAVRAERRRADEVDDGLAGDERSAGLRFGRHAGEVLLA